MPSELTTTAKSGFEILPAGADASVVPAPPASMDGIATPLPFRLFTALAKAQAAFTPVVKSKTAKIRPREGGTEFTYKYADLADILMMAQPILAREGLCVIQPIRRIGQGTYVVTEIHHSSGECYTDDGLPLVAGGSPQAFGSGLTYMRRYGYCSMTGIQADQDEDGQLATAEKAEQTAAAAARARTERAAGTSAPPTPPKADQEAKPAGDTAWSVEMVSEFDQARRKAGWKKDPTLAYVREVLGVASGNPNGAMAAQFEAAMAWANGGPTKPDPKDASGAASPTPTTAKGGTAGGVDTSSSGGTTLDGAQQRQVWDTARKHGKTDGDIASYMRHTLGLETTAAIKVSQLADVLTWATKRDDLPPAGDDEKRARQGMGILGLNLSQMGELVDGHKGDWKSIADHVSAEIARRDEDQP